MSRISRHYYTVILIIALALRVANLGGTSLWYDECLTARMTWLLSPAKILDGTALDVHPPLYYLLIAGWRQFAGSSEFALRFPSVIFGTILLMVWKRIGEQLRFSPRVILLGLSLMAVSPPLIFYSQELRMYSLLCLAISIATLGVLRQSALRLIVGGAIAMWSQNMAWAYLLCLGILALVIGWPFRKLVWASGMIGLFYLPWLPRLLAQINALDTGYWIPHLSPGSLPYSIYPLVWFFAVPSWAAVHAGILALGLAVLAIWKAIPAAKRTYPLLVLWLGPMAMIAIASLVWTPIYFYRPLLAIVPPMLFLFAHALLKINKRNTIAIAILCVPLLTMGLYRQLGDRHGFREPERDNAQILVNLWRQGDCIFHLNVGSIISMLYYLPDYPQYVWNGPAALHNGALSVATQEKLLLDRRAFEELPPMCTRVWLEWWANPLTPPEEDMEAKRLIAQYGGVKIHTFEDNEMVEATLWRLERDSYTASP